MRKVAFLFLMFLKLTANSQELDTLRHYKQSIKENLSDTVQINRFYNKLFTFRKNISEDTLTAYCLFIYQIVTQQSNYEAKGYACSTLGNVYNGTGDYNKALKYLFEAERIYTLLNNQRRLAATYNTIGNTYLGLNNIDAQKKYFTKCYDISVKNNLPEQMALGAGGIANCYSSEKKYKQSNEWNFIAEKLFKEQKFMIGYSIILENIAENYCQMNDLDMAMQYCKKAEACVMETQFNYAIYGCFKGKGNILEKQKKYAESIEAYKVALGYILKDKANHNIAEIYQLLSYTSEKNNEPIQSLGFLKLHIQYKDSVFNENSQKQLLDVEKKYETEKKDAEIKILNKENDLAKSELSRKKTVLYSAVTGLLFLMVMIFFVIRSNWQKNKVNKLLESQKIIIEEKQKEILDSIHYAKRIQHTLLNYHQIITDNVKDYFLLFNPKDIVSGDFYWAYKKENKFYLAVCDSTGHGVPGAFMSLLNIGFLNEAVNEKHLVKPNEIFNYVRQRLISSISKEGQRDGFDGILICIDEVTFEINYASANNVPLLISEQKNIELKKNKMPVGLGEHIDSFELFELPYKKGDVLYLYTDGYADQFGGPEGKKFKYKKLNELLLSLNSYECAKQKEILTETFDKWKGNLEQIDDVLVLGIKL